MNPNPQTIQKMLDENAHLIKVLVEIQNTKGKAMECIQYQQTLHRNLAFLANLADPTVNIQSILPPPGTNMMPPRIPSSQEQASGSVPPYSMAAMQQRPSLPPSSQPTWPGEPQPASGSSQQQMGMPSYGTMGGWGGGQPNPYSMQSQQQNPMPSSEEQRKMLRMRQEQLIMQQRKATQQQQGGQQQLSASSMYHSSSGPVMMGGGNYSQPNSISPGPSGPLT